MRRITESSMLRGNLTENFRVEIAQVPQGCDFRAAVWECDDRSICLPNTSGSLWMRVFELQSESPIAVATFAADDQVVRCDTIEVEDDYLRKGIATALYVKASCIFGAPVIPSDDLSEDGQSFWAGIGEKFGGRNEISCNMYD